MVYPDREAVCVIVRVQIPAVILHDYPSLVVAGAQCEEDAVAGYVGRRHAV